MTMVVNTLAPLILIVLLGVVLRKTGFTPREFYRGTNRLVYWVGLPCLLFDKTSGGQAAAAIKLVCCPLLGLAAATLIGARPAETRIALLYLACPTAVIAFVMAEQLGGDEQLSGSAIVLSTVFSTASLAAVLLCT